MVLKAEGGELELTVYSWETEFNVLVTAVDGKGKEVMAAWFPDRGMLVTVAERMVKGWIKDESKTEFFRGQVVADHCKFGGVRGA